MICTFYSYKGGVGRSMALANVADVLSRRGLRVLMIDFDLEAPGLEQFFYRGDEREQRDAVRRQPGLLDLLLAYKEAMSVSGGGDEFRAIDKYVAGIFPRRPHGGCLDLLPAGQRLTTEQLARYALALRSFDWQDFYFNWEGDLFFEWLRRALVPERYDLVLIDSRTGVTEMGGICGYQLADVIVMMCGANHQNVDGTWSMLEDFRSHAVEGLRRGRPLEIVVVPARVEQRAPALLSEFFERFDRRFGELLPARLSAAGVGFRDLTIPYDPQFAFEERVARNPEEKAAKEHLASIFSHLADVITALAPAGQPADGPLARVARESLARLAGAPPAGAAPAPPPREETTQARYDETKRFADFDVLLSYARADAAMVSELRHALEREGARAAIDAADGAVGADWKLRMEDTLAHARALAVCLGGSGFEAQQQRLVALALLARDAGRDLAVLPVLLPGHAGDAPSDRALAEFFTVDLRHGLAADAIGRLVSILRRPQARSPVTQMPEAAPIESEERCPYIGPTPFAEHHADLFFGRAEEIRALTEEIEQSPVVLLIGPSGCGKTSLLRAGLFPALRRAYPDWKLVAAPTANRTGRAVARALPNATTQMPDMRDAFDAIAERPRGSVVVAIDALSDPPRAGAPPARDGEPVEFPPGTARGTLVEAVVRALVQRGARVVMNLRSDEVDEWEQAVHGTPLQGAHRVMLAPPGPGALREIIERPADRAGLALEPGLVDRLMSRAENEPGVLPFLQIALVRLWEKRRSGWLTNGAYDGFGGLRGVIVEQADGCYEALDADGREHMRRIMLRLLQIAAGGTRASGHRVRVAKLAARGSAAEAVLRELIDAHLVIATRDRDEAAVEIAHEALARDWPRVLIWLERQRDFLEWLHRIQAEADAWIAADRARSALLQGAPLDEAMRMAEQYGDEVGADVRAFVAAGAELREHQRSRRMRVISGLTTVFLVIALAAAAGWYRSGRNASELRDQTMELLKELRALEGERNSAEAQRVQAQAQLDELQKSLNEALASLDATRSATRGDNVPPMPVTAAVAVPIERAVEQAREVVQQQQSYARARKIEIDRQQNVIRNIITRSSTARPPEGK